MKKILFFIILFFISLIPLIKVYAIDSSNTSKLVVYYNTTPPVDDFNYELKSWVLNTSFSYLNSLKSGYSNYLIFYHDFYNPNYLNVKSFYIDIILDNNINSISSDWRSSNPKGLYYNGSTSDKFIRLVVYQDFHNWKYYLDENMTTEITSLSDSNILINNTNQTYNISDASSYNWIKTFTSSSSITGLLILDTNMVLSNSYFGSSYNRYLSYYDADNDVSHNYYIGDTVPSFFSILNPIPDYLIGYEKVGLTPSYNTIIISNVNKGSIYISREDWDKCTGLFGYFDKDLSSQPYNSIITDYTYTPDDLYIRQDFDISTYPGADYMYYQKCQIINPDDNIYKYIWLPDENYTSNITSTPNNTGGLDYSYSVEENGEIVENTFSSLDNILDSTNPLLGNIFQNFSSNTFGLTAIITAPLSLITSLSSSTCNDLSVPLPYINSNLTLPCMSNIYQNTFGSFFTLYQTITFGIVSYWVIVRIWNLVKDFKNPDHDEIEVLDL